MNLSFIGLIGVVVLILIIFVALYNNLVSSKNATIYAYSSIDALLRKRFDLIPNLVHIAKEYMNYEKDLLDKLTQLRTQFKSNAMSSAELGKLDVESRQLIKQVLVTAENYPDLKANQNMLQLQASLNEVEEQISAARRAFNASVMKYNNSIMQFPSNIVARLFNFKRLEPFSIPEEQKQPIDIKSMFNE